MNVSRLASEVCGGAHFLQVLDFWTFSKCKMLLLIVQDKEIKLASFPGTDFSPPPPPDLGTRLPCALSIGNSSQSCSMQQWRRGWSESIYHVSDLNLLIGTQSGEGLKEHFVCTCSLFWTMSSDLCTLQMFRTPIHGLMLQEKASFMLFDINMSTQVDRGAYIVQHRGGWKLVISDARSPN